MSSATVVRMSTLARLARSTIQRVASMPFSSGSVMSMTTTSGCSSSAISTALRPSPVSPTISILSSVARMRRRPWRTTVCASTSRTRTRAGSRRATAVMDRREPPRRNLPGSAWRRLPSGRPPSIIRRLTRARGRVVSPDTAAAPPRRRLAPRLTNSQTNDHRGTRAGVPVTSYPPTRDRSITPFRYGAASNALRPSGASNGPGTPKGGGGQVCVGDAGPAGRKAATLPGGSADDPAGSSREQPQTRPPEGDIGDRRHHQHGPREHVPSAGPRPQVRRTRAPRVEAAQLERHRHAVGAAERADQDGDEDGDEAAEPGHDPAAAELEPAAALRLHDGERGVEEDRHEAEGERQREAHDVRQAQATERVGHLLDARGGEEEDARGEEGVETDRGREPVEEARPGRPEAAAVEERPHDEREDEHQDEHHA